MTGEVQGTPAKMSILQLVRRKPSRQQEVGNEEIEFNARGAKAQRTEPPDFGAFAALREILRVVARRSSAAAAAFQGTR